MTITLDDDLSARLSEEARRRGQDPDAVAAALLRAGLEGPATDEEWERLINEMADLVDPNVPPLSDHAVSREGIYESHP
jgi:hypothetical protein